MILGLLGDKKKTPHIRTKSPIGHFLIPPSSCYISKNDGEVMEGAGPAVAGGLSGVIRGKCGQVPPSLENHFRGELRDQRWKNSKIGEGKAQLKCQFKGGDGRNCRQRRRRVAWQLRIGGGEAACCSTV